MFHVFIRLKGSEADRPLLLNLTEAELQRRFAEPYLDGKDLFDKGSITRISDISKVIILGSELTAEATLMKMSADHRAELERIKREEGLSVHGSFRGRDVTELVGYCDDVTESKVARPPGVGTKRTRLVKFLHNP